MAEEATTETITTETTETDVKDWKVEAEKWQTLARKNEDRAKGNASAVKELSQLQTRLKEFEDRDKTELQKLAEAQQGAEQRATSAESALARYRVATAKGLPAELVDRLRGSTEDELGEDADRLLELVGRRPGGVPSFDGGARTTASGPVDMNKALRRAAGRE